MSAGSTLLELQENDLELMRTKEQLQAMPEIASLAKKRKVYLKLKNEATRLFAERKDVESDLEELDNQEQACNEGIDRARREVDMSEYKQVQELEIQLSNFAKQLDKIAYDRAATQEALKKAKASEAELKAKIEKLEANIVAETKSTRTRAAELQAAIEKSERMHNHLLELVPADLAAAYNKAAKRFNGLAVERLEGNVPSVCRMALQSSSMDDLKHAGEVNECPYCHRLMIIASDEE